MERKLRGGAPVWVLYCLPALLFFIALIATPFFNTIRISFFDWDGLTEPEFVGLENYRQIWADSALLMSFRNSLIFVVFFCIFPVAIGIVIAALMARRNLPGISMFRVIFFLPQIISGLVIGIAWRWMYSLDGTVNQILRGIGLDSVARGWLGDWTWAIIAVGLIGTWSLTGLTMILFIAGIQKIDSQLYDAVRIDGAGAIREFFCVTIPGLRSEIAVAITVTMIAALKTFDIVYATTNGGPGTSTRVPSIAIFQLAFFEFKLGAAAAVGTTLAFIVAFAILLINLLIRKPE